MIIITMISDSARNSPMSDHSSHFDSVSGTAINLGMHSVNEKGSLHYPKVKIMVIIVAIMLVIMLVIMLMIMVVFMVMIMVMIMVVIMVLTMGND